MAPNFIKKVVIPMQKNRTHISKIATIHILRNQFSKAKIRRGILPKKREESSADFVYRVGSFSAVSFSSAKNISTFF